MLKIATDYYQSFIRQLMDRVPCVESEEIDGILHVPCDADYPDIFFMFGMHWIEVQAKNYVVPVSQGSSECVFYI